MSTVSYGIAVFEARSAGPRCGRTPKSSVSTTPVHKSEPQEAREKAKIGHTNCDLDTYIYIYIYTYIYI